jgi:hypothetical protein
MKIPKPTLAAIWLVLPVLLTLLIIWTNSQFPLDFWLHVNSGRWMCEHHQLVTVDTFTHTIFGQPIRNQPWLAQLLMFQLFQSGGYPLTQCVLGAAYGAAVGLMTLLTYRRSADSRVTAAVMIAAVAVASTNLAIRPQAFSVLLFAAELYALSTWGARRFTPWVVAIIELLWTNMHGAFPLGVVLPGIFLVGAIGQRLRQSGPAAAASTALARGYFHCCAWAAIAMFINPQGLATLRYVSGVASRATARHIEEWLPTSIDSPAGLAFTLSVAGALLVLCSSRRRVSLTDGLLLATFFLAGAQSQRMVIWWALVFPPILAPHVGVSWSRCVRVAQAAWPVVRDRATRWLPGGPGARRAWQTGRLGQWISRIAGVLTPSDEQSGLVNWIAAVSLGALTLLSTPWTRTYNPLLPPDKRVAAPVDEPRGAVQFLAAAGYEGRMYQPMEWGSYVSWQLDPRVKVFVDSRIDFFPDRVWTDYVTVGTRPERALATLDRYGVNLVLWDPRLSRELPALLDTAPDWQHVYGDRTSVVFVRQAGSLSYHGRLEAYPTMTGRMPVPR